MKRPRLDQMWKQLEDVVAGHIPTHDDYMQAVDLLRELRKEERDLSKDLYRQRNEAYQEILDLEELLEEMDDEIKQLRGGGHEPEE